MKKLLLIPFILLPLVGCSNPVEPSKYTQSYKIHFNKDIHGDWYFTVNGENKTTILFEDQEVIIYSQCN